MPEPSEPFKLHDRDTKAPSLKAPPGSCDCAVHVFADPARYPPADAGSYAPPLATINDLERMHGVLGIDRAVIVQATTYGVDHRLLVDTLKGRSNYRGVAIIDDRVTEKDIEVMHQAGVRAARFNFARFLNIVPEAALVKRTVDRVAPHGWHIRIHGDYDEIIEHMPYLRSLRIPLVIDHLGRLDFAKGEQQPGFGLMLDLLRNENWWMMLSNGDRLSAQPRPWADTVPFARAFVDAAPDRIIWATDWPHVRYRRDMPNDAELLDLLCAYAPDPVARRKILVDNPSRLYGF